MSTSIVDRVWADVSEHVGDDLRVVTRFEAMEFETRMRDDVREQYTTGEDQTIVDDTIITQLGLEDTEDAFKAGPLDALVRVFRDAWVLSWGDHLPGKSGVIVSIQRDGGTASIDDLEWCIEYLDTEIAPLLDV